MGIILQALQAVSIIIAAGAACYSLMTWRRQLVWGKRVELAEKVLASFYEARDAIEAARHPFSLPHEGGTRPRHDDEQEDRARELDRYYIPIERLERKSVFFSELSALRYRFMAYFGAASAIPFDTIYNIRTEVNNAAVWLMRLEQGRAPRNHDRREEMRDRYENAIYQFNTEPDQILESLTEAVRAIERTCRPVLLEEPLQPFLSKSHDHIKRAKSLASSRFYKYILRRDSPITVPEDDLLP